MLLNGRCSGRLECIIGLLPKLGRSFFLHTLPIGIGTLHAYVRFVLSWMGHPLMAVGMATDTGVIYPTMTGGLAGVSLPS